MAQNKEVKNIGIVISGGFARGAAQLAFAMPLIEKIGYDRVKVLSGASIGSLNCFAISTHKTNELLKFYRNLDIDNIRGFLKAMKGRIYSKVFNLVESKNMEIPTYVNATKLPSLEPYYFCLNSMNRQDLKKCLNASMGFPVVNGRKRFKGQLFMDGGTCDNVPIYPLDYFDLDMVIVIHCYAKYYPQESHLRKDRIFIDVDATLPLSEKITTFSFKKEEINMMIESGYKDGQEFADEVFKDFSFDGIKERCRDYTLKRVDRRQEKSRDILTIVDVTNALYRLKMGE